MGELTIVEGDITRQAVDAIVNAANETLLGGGGVDGAIHRAAGSRLLEACRAIPEVRPGVRCPTGEARATPGFRLAASWVIHAVGPVYSGTERDARLLAAAHDASLQAAEERGAVTVAFPAISCGVYGYPPEEAAPIAIRACRARLDAFREVRFVLFSETMRRVWEEAAAG